MFDKGFYKEDWLHNVLDFLGWCDREMIKCRPTGFHLQSMHITSGKAAFDEKFPNFREAYAAYQKYVTERLGGG